MDVNFKVTEPAKSEPIVFDVIFAEKVGGGRVKNCAYDLPAGVAVDAAGNAIKCYKVYEDAESDATAIKILKGSGVAVNDIFATGAVAVKCTAVDASNDAYDVVTVSLGVAVEAGDTLYNALAESVEAGYYDATSGTEGALKVVASGASDGQINLADVTPYKGSKSPLAANDYVLWKDEVKAEPKYAPAFVLGESIPANSGDKLVKLVNGANVRKETIQIAKDVLALMPMIAAL